MRPKRDPEGAAAVAVISAFFGGLRVSLGTQALVARRSPVVAAAGAVAGFGGMQLDLLPLPDLPDDVLAGLACADARP